MRLRLRCVTLPELELHGLPVELDMLSEATVESAAAVEEDEVAVSVDWVESSVDDDVESAAASLEELHSVSHRSRVIANMHTHLCTGGGGGCACTSM